LIVSDILLLETKNFENKSIFQVIDTETGRELGPNQRGELCAKGPQVKADLNSATKSKFHFHQLPCL